MSSTTVCVTDTSVIPFPTLDSTYTQTSNTASNPLPHIPCRNARSNPLLSFSDISTSDSNASINFGGADCAPPNLVTYVRYDSSSSSSSTPSDETRPTIVPRSKRTACQQSSTVASRDIPIPASTPIKPRAIGRSFTDLERRETPLRNPPDEKDILRPFSVVRQAPLCKSKLEGFTGKHVRHASDSGHRAPAVATVNTNQPPHTIRKKSGQPVKSSLKSARRPELHVDTGGSVAKSEPVTPTHAKAVHFDSKLEHVKLFLAEQKPLAVSRDGSPTSDTSGDDFPPFIYGDHDNKRITMLVPNMPPSPRTEESVALQKLVLSQEQRTITGSVRVRNIAYEKWLAIRFTLDWWQTTSEVTARHDKSIEHGAIDVFAFSIRLHDIWSRIEEKTIFLALRYAVAGQEYWDNNAGKNYHIKFVLERPSEPPNAVDNEEGLKDLDLKLEDLAKTRSAPIPIAPSRLGRSFSADRYPSSAQSSGQHELPKVYKAQWVKNGPPPPTRHTRTHTFPSGVPTTADPVVSPWSAALKTHQTEEVATSPRPPSPLPLSAGSPRGAMDSICAPSETTAALFDTHGPPHSPDGRMRNHRRGFMDGAMERSPTLRRTPTGSPLRFDVANQDGAAELPRTWSYPLVGQELGLKGSLPRQLTSKPALSVQVASVSDGRSEESTPYDVPQSSSGNTSSDTPLISPDSDCSRRDTSYKQLLDQFCFYTGTDSPLREPSEPIPRSQSASSIQRYLLSHSPPPSFSSHPHEVPTRLPFDPSSPTGLTAVRV